MEILHNIVLAIVQGLTEFLPISSSAHLIIIPELFGWEQHSLDFDIALHVGTLTAAIYYFKDKLKYLINPFHPLTIKLIIATIPVCIVGFLTKPYIELYLRGPIIIAITTIVFGLLLGYAQYKEQDKLHDFKEINFFYAFIIGLAQCLALIPGTSRSGITIAAALLIGVGRKTSAEFSFLLSMPVIFLGGALLSLDMLQNPALVDINLYSYLYGFTISAIVAMLSMYTFINIVERVGMMPFVIYRLILGVFLLYIFY